RAEGHADPPADVAGARLSGAGRQVVEQAGQRQRQRDAQDGGGHAGSLAVDSGTAVALARQSCLANYVSAASAGMARTFCLSTPNVDNSVHGRCVRGSRPRENSVQALLAKNSPNRVFPCGSTTWP